MNNNNRTIKQTQQDFANIYGYRNEIVWDFISEEQSHILKQKINGIILNVEENDVINKLRDELFTKIWAQRKYTNKNLQSAIIYILVTDNKNLKEAVNSSEFSCHPVFRTQRCNNEGSSENCCMIFIDENGRVYQNWKAYIENNCLAAGTLVAPKNGVYNIDANENVILEMHTTPAGTVTSQFLSVADSTASIVGMGCLVGTLSTLVLTVAAPIAAVSLVAGTAVTTYSSIRAASSLVDRDTHEQTVSVSDRQARNAWINVAAGFVGLGSLGATRHLVRAAATTGSEISLLTRSTVNAFNVTSITLSGASVMNNGYDLYLKVQSGEEISTLDVLQVTASAIVLTHSVLNYKMAAQIIRETQSNTINSYRETLSNRQRRAFDKLSKETIRIRGETKGKMDIIRNVNENPSKQYLNDLYRINKKLNDAKVRPSFASEATGITLNNDINVDANVLRNNVQHNIGADILGQVRNPIPQTNNLENYNRNAYNEMLKNSTVENWNNNNINIILSQINTLKPVAQQIFERTSSGESLRNILLSMTENMCQSITEYLFEIVVVFIEKYVKRVEVVIRRFISSEDIVQNLINIFVREYRHLPREQLDNVKEEIIQKLRAFFERLRIDDVSGISIQCKNCVGSYIITKL